MVVPMVPHFGIARLVDIYIYIYIEISIYIYIYIPIGSMYGIFTNIYPINDPNVGKYTIHGSYGIG